VAASEVREGCLLGDILVRVGCKTGKGAKSLDI